MSWVPWRWTLLAILMALILVSPAAWAACDPAWIFCDEFERSDLTATGDWSVNSAGGDARIGSETANSPSRSLVTRWGNVTVSSRAIDLSGFSGVFVDYWWRRGDDAFSEDPDGNEDLLVQYLDDTGNWATLESVPGSGSPGEMMSRSFQLPADALHPGFQLRFAQANGSGSDFDYWHVDDVVLRDAANVQTFCDTLTVLFCDDFERFGLGSDWVVTGAGGDTGIGSQTAQSGSRSLFTRWGEVTLTSPVFDLSGMSSATLDYWWRRGDDAFSEDPDNNEDLQAQYLDVNGNWITIEALSGNGPDGQSGTTRFDLPADALHAGFRFRFRQTRGSGQDFDYWHLDDVVLDGTPAISQTCFNDAFSGATLPPDDWATAVINDSLPPRVVNGRLRMTDAIGNQSAAASLQRLIPGEGNRVELVFDYFAYGGNGADGLAVVLSDASVSPQPGSFGGSLGYAQRNNGDPGFAGGWIGIGLDEFGNFSNDNEGRVGGPGFRRDAVAIRGAAQNDYPYLRGTQTLNPGIDQPNTNNPTAHRYRIIVDSQVPGQTIVSVERDTTGTGNNFQTLIPPFDAIGATGQPPVPENFLLSFTGSTGGSTNIHELDNLELCALALNPIDQVDHFELIHDGTALTCQPETVGIQACADASCDTLFTDPVEVTLSPSGWVGGDTFTFSNGFAERQLQNTTAGTLTLGVAGSDPPARSFADTLCDSGTGSPGTGQCELEFLDSGLAFTVPDLIAGKPSGTIQVRAVERNNETNACVPAFANVTRDVRFWSDYVDPDANNRPASRSVEVNGDAVGQDAASATTLSLSFDGNGEAAIEVRYTDAGQLNLNALYEGSTATGDAGLMMPGADGFVARPAGLCLQTPGDCPAGDISCPVFRAAGADFSLSLQAMAWESDMDGNLCDNLDTPNYEQANISLGHSLVAPAAGVAGTVGQTVYDHSRAGNATTTVTQTVSEVGLFRFNATPPSGGYFGLTVAGGESAPVGRFIPDRFGLSVADPGEVAPFCETGTAFAYSGQDLGWRTNGEPEIRIRALATAGSLTRNYTIAPFLRLAASDAGWTPDSADALATDATGAPFPVVTSLDQGSLTIDSPGELLYRFADTDQVRYEKSPDAQVAPFGPDYSIALTTLTDADGVTPNAGALPFPVSPLFNFEMRYGRLRLENAFGPETEALQVPMQAQYFDGSNFVTHTDDSCWSYDTGTQVTLDPTGLTTVIAATDTLQQGRPPAGSELRLSAPGTGNTGQVRVDFTGAPLWLHHDADQDGSLDLPAATATFGVYRGHDRVIYWRERSQ